MLKSARFTERMESIGDPGTRGPKPTQCCVRNLAYAKVGLLSTLAKQTGLHTIATSSEPGRVKQASEIAGAACGRARDLRERITIEGVGADSEFAPHLQNKWAKVSWAIPPQFSSVQGNRPAT